MAETTKTLKLKIIGDLTGLEAQIKALEARGIRFGVGEGGAGGVAAAGAGRTATEGTIPQPVPPLPPAVSTVAARSAQDARLREQAIDSARRRSDVAAERGQLQFDDGFRPRWARGRRGAADDGFEAASSRLDAAFDLANQRLDAMEGVSRPRAPRNAVEARVERNWDAAAFAQFKLDERAKTARPRGAWGRFFGPPDPGGIRAIAGFGALEIGRSALAFGTASNAAGFGASLEDQAQGFLASADTASSGFAGAIANLFVDPFGSSRARTGQILGAARSQEQRIELSKQLGYAHEDSGTILRITSSRGFSRESAQAQLSLSRSKRENEATRLVSQKFSDDEIKSAESGFKDSLERRTRQSDPLGFWGRAFSTGEALDAADESRRKGFRTTDAITIGNMRTEQAALRDKSKNQADADATKLYEEQSRQINNDIQVLRKADTSAGSVAALQAGGQTAAAANLALTNKQTAEQLEFNNAFKFMPLPIFVASKAAMLGRQSGERAILAAGQSDISNQLRLGARSLESTLSGAPLAAALQAIESNRGVVRGPWGSVMRIGGSEPGDTDYQTKVDAFKADSALARLEYTNNVAATGARANLLRAQAGGRGFTGQQDYVRAIFATRLAAAKGDPVLTDAIQGELDATLAGNVAERAFTSKIFGIETQGRIDAQRAFRGGVTGEDAQAVQIGTAAKSRIAQLIQSQAPPEDIRLAATEARENLKTLQFEFLNPRNFKGEQINAAAVSPFGGNNQGLGELLEEIKKQTDAITAMEETIRTKFPNIVN